jgi:hypothetical protein
MKRKLLSSIIRRSGEFTALLFLSTLNLATSLAQGSLTPPGAPGPTMKSLSQIEPRTPVDATNTPGDSSALFVISQPGSYYLTTNIFGVINKYGIAISTDNVTLDLNGFALLGNASSVDGIVVFFYSHIVIRNGTVSGWGTGNYGIRCLGKNATLERLTVSVNDFGISCNSGDVIRDCVINGNQRDGIDVNGSGAFILNNNLAGNTSFAGNACISIDGSNHRVEGNHVVGTGTGFGIQILGGVGWTNNIVIRNSVIGDGGNNYSIGSNNIVGPLINTTGTITNSNPWANFSY